MRLPSLEQAKRALARSHTGVRHRVSGFLGRGDEPLATHVRIRNGARLRALVATAGSQRSVAKRAGMSFQLLNALISGVRPVIAVELAARLEDSLSVPRGSLFEHDTPELVAPYVATVGDGLEPPSVDASTSSNGSGDPYASTASADARADVREGAA